MFRHSCHALLALSVFVGCSSMPVEPAGCPTGLATCGDRCVALANDPANCGACGTACGAGTFCSAGQCVTSCGPGLNICSGSCRDLSSDRANCGACGTSCQAGEVCSSGQCVTSCGQGLTDCSGSCRDLASDRANCGACGTSCQAGEVCSSGQCVTSCGQGLTDCSGSCRDLASDRANCGACGTSCQAGEVCSSGQCVTSCGQGLTECSGSCRDLTSDRANCGACGTACQAGEVCSAGQCVTSCGQGLTACSGSCRDLASDRGNCGACGTACQAGEVCSSGQCATSCGGLTNCSNTCVDTRYDPAHCGGCGLACAVPANAAATCANGACGFLCSPMRADCDRSSTNGCEADLSADVANCGACDNACPVPAQGSAACVTGTCGLGSCQTGYDNCDGNPANGCEASLLDDEANCGMCGFACNPGQLCSNGVCALATTTLVPGNTTLIVARDGVEATCHQWSNNVCVQPKLRPINLSCTTYAYRNDWHAIHFDGNFYCWYATGNRTVVSTAASTWAGPPTVHGHWSTNTCATTAATVPHGHAAGELSQGTSLAWDYARGAIGSVAVECVW